MSRGARVVVDRVSKAFDGGRIRALNDASLELGAGEFASLTGPSGSGKSTLLNLIGALDRPDAGSIVIDGVPLDGGDGAEYRAATVGFVFQSHNLIPTLTALENVQVPMLGRGLSRGERVLRARDLLGEVGLGNRADAFPGTLSGGERQRVAIARALAAGPDLVVCDEITSALDVSVQAAVLELLAELRADLGLALLLITHDLGVVASVADRVVVLESGCICEQGEVEPLLSDPGHEYTQRLVAAAPTLGSRV